MAFFERMTWANGRENPASLAAAAWVILSLVILITLLNSDIAMLPTATGPLAFKSRVFSGWFVVAFLAMPIFGLIMGMNRFKRIPYLFTWTASIFALAFCCLFQMRSGYVIANGEVIFRAAEPWRSDEILKPEKAVGLTQGCTTIYGKGVTYRPEYGLVFRHGGKLVRYDVGAGANLRNSGEWTNSVAALRFGELSFRKESGGNPFWRRSEGADALRQDAAFKECLQAYSKVLDRPTFSRFKALVGAPG